MLTMTATEVSRNFSRVLDSLDAEQETVLIMRKNAQWRGLCMNRNA